MITAQKGTKDIWGNEVDKWHFVENAMRDVFENANYKGNGNTRKGQR